MPSSSGTSSTSTSGSKGPSSSASSSSTAPHVEWLVCDANVAPELLVDDLHATVQVH